MKKFGKMEGLIGNLSALGLAFLAILDSTKIMHIVLNKTIYGLGFLPPTPNLLTQVRSEETAIAGCRVCRDV